MGLANTPLDLYQYTLTQTVSLGWSRALPTAPMKSSIMCSVNPMSGSEQDNYYRRRQINATHTIYSNYDFLTELAGGKDLTLGYVFKDPAKNQFYQLREVNRYEQPTFRDPVVYEIRAERIVA